MKGTYGTVKGILGWTNNYQPKMFLVGGILERKLVNIANILQKFYKEKVENLVKELKKGGRGPLRFLNAVLQKWESGGRIPTFPLKEITEKETRDYIMKLGNTAAAGIDRLDAMTVKLAVDKLTRPINHIINMSIRTQTFANRWKFSKIIPILKSPEVSRLKHSSYRPVTLLPTISKLTERAVQMQLQKHMEQAVLLNSNSQNLSTLTAILQLVDKLYSAMDDNLISELMAINQSSAFDCISHPILLQKLEKYGCSDTTIKWMTSYLQWRTQYTNVGLHNSDMVASVRGVPQGSILGPLLYLIYINKMSEVLKDPECCNTSHEDTTKLFGKNCNDCGILVMYADDATVHVKSKHRKINQARINRHLEQLELYLTGNELAINEGKTAILETMIKQKKAENQGNHLI